jgi:putative transposase
MKKSRYTDSQILNILKQAENGVPIPELCREHGMSSATFYKWRAKYGGMDASLMARMKELERENRQLKQRLSRKPLKKSGKAVLSPQDGKGSREREKGQYPTGVCCVFHKPDVLQI